MTVIDSLVGRVPLLASLPPTEIERLAATLPRIRVAAGTVLFREGERGDSFFILLDGEIEIVKALGSADERLISLRLPGEFVGEMSLFNADGLRTASVRASADTEALVLTRAQFDELLHRYPTMAYEMLRVLSSRLRVSHDAAIRDLHERNERLSQAYAELQAAQAQIIEQQTMLRELELAREIQRSMLPQTLPQIAGWDVGGCMIPARMVGGDFYDFIRTGPEGLGIAVGDVSGKGVPAALFMARASSLLRAAVKGGAGPEEVAAALNAHLGERNAQRMFLTLLYGVLDTRRRELRYVRAGHEPLLAWDAAGAPLAVGFGRALPLGMFPAPLLDAGTLQLPPGGTLLMCSDGAIEGMDPRGGLFGRDRLFELASAHRGTAQELCEDLVRALAAHQGDAARSDDITLVALRSLPDAA